MKKINTHKKPCFRIFNKMILSLSLCLFTFIGISQNNVVFNDILLNSIDENTSLTMTESNGEQAVLVGNVTGEQLNFGFQANVDNTKQIELDFVSLNLSTPGSFWQLALNSNSGNSPGKLLFEQTQEGSILKLQESMYGGQPIQVKVYQDGEVTGEVMAEGDMIGILFGNPAVTSLGAYPTDGMLSLWVVTEEPFVFMGNSGMEISGDELEITIMETQGLENFQQFDFQVIDAMEGFVLEHVQGNYPTPQIAEINPGVASSGDLMTIQGENLSDVVQVNFNSNSGNGTINADFTILNDNAIEVTVPASATEMVELVTFFGEMAQSPVEITASCKVPTALFANIVRAENDISADLTWESENPSSVFEMQYRVNETENWSSEYLNSNQFSLSNLEYPVEYEWRVREECNDEFSDSNVFSTEYGDNIYVSQVVFDKVQDWIALGEETSTNSIYEFIQEGSDIPTVELTSFLISYTNGAWPYFEYYVPCYCKTIQVNTSIQVEPGVGYLNLLPKLSTNYTSSDNKGRKRHSYHTYKIDHGPSYHMKYVFSGHRRTKNATTINLHKGSAPPNLSKLSITYLCTQNGVSSFECGCVKELDIDVKYDSNHWLDKTKASQRSSHVKSKTEEYAFIYTVEQPSNDYKLLYADFAGKHKEDQVSWNPQAFVNIVDLAAIVAKAILAGNVTAADITSLQGTLTSMITTPFQIKSFSSSGQQGIGIGGKKTLQMKPNTTRTVGMHSNGSIYAEGKGKGRSRWNATAEIHSNYRMSMVFEPRPATDKAWCCYKSIGMWDLGSLGWRAPKSVSVLRNSVGAHLTTYHGAQNWVGLGSTNYGGVYHLNINKNRYYRVEAKNTCPPYADPPTGWVWYHYEQHGLKAGNTAPESIAAMKEIDVKESQKTESSITPNPFSTRAMVNYNLPKNTLQANLYIYDVNGAIVKNIPLDNMNTSYSFNAQELTNGVYFFLIFADGIQISANKMIVQK